MDTTTQEKRVELSSDSKTTDAKSEQEKDKASVQMFWQTYPLTTGSGQNAT